MADDISPLTAGGGGGKVDPDCFQVADVLRLRGAGAQRFCPRCQAQTNGKSMPALHLSLRKFQCSNCGKSGDAIDLVSLANDFDDDEAEEWIDSQTYPPSSAPPELLNPSGSAPAKAEAAAPASSPKPAAAPAKPAGGPAAESAVKASSKPARIDDVPIIPVDDEEAPIVEVEDDQVGLEAVTAAVNALRSPQAEQSAMPAVSLSAAQGDSSEQDAQILQHEAVLTAFLADCRALPDKVLKLLDNLGIKPAVAERFGLRYYPTDYDQMLVELENEFGSDVMFASGLLVDGSAADSTQMSPDDSDGPGGSSIISSTVQGCFAAFHKASVPYLIWPLLYKDRPVCLRARPLVDKKKITELDLPREISTQADLPCLFNSDCLAVADQVLLFRREFDAMSAVSAGVHAMAYVSASRFQRQWARQLAGKRVGLVSVDAKSDPDRVQRISQLFASLGLAEPEKYDVPPATPVAKWIAVQNPVARMSTPALPPSPELEMDSAEGELDLGEDEGEEAELQLNLQSSPEQFAALVDGGVRRSIAIHTRVVHGHQLIKLRYWFQSRDGKSWRPEDSLTIELPAETVENLAAALTAGNSGAALGPVPDWMIAAIAAQRGG